MNFDFLNAFSDNTRLWLYQSPREFSADELSWIGAEGSKFAEGWQTHGAEMKATVTVLYNRFVVIASDQEVTANSGCSIDSSVRFIKQLELKTGLNLMDRMLVYYLNTNGEPVSFHFHDLNKLVESGVLTDETPIFNPLVNTKPELMNNWLLPLKASWLSSFMKQTT